MPQTTVTTMKAAQLQPVPTFAKTIAIAYVFVVGVGTGSNSVLHACAFVPQPRQHHRDANFGELLQRQHQHHHCRSSRSNFNSLQWLSSESDDSNIGEQSLPPPNVLCVGETLWDSLPSGIYLGGAPSNVAVHLASLFKMSSASPSSTSNSPTPTVAIAACLGEDQLGKEARRRLSIKGVRTDYIQFHPEWETGMATALIDENGDATYEFNTPAAWDGLCLEQQLVDLMVQDNDNDDDETTRSTTNDVVFVMGTIAGRLQNNNDHGATSCTTLTTMRSCAPEGTVVLDVNLRSPWYTPESVLKLARGSATVEGDGDTASSSKNDHDQSPRKLALLKLNEEELCILEEWCGLKGFSSNGANKNDGLSGSILKERMEHLAISLNTQRVCVTRGKDGAALLCKGSDDDDDDDDYQYYETAGYSLSINNDSDTVGAGDAFLAALVSSLFVQDELPERALERACALGGYVAGCRGATPEHGDAPEELQSVFSNSM